jgi:hypothetical protein
MCLNKYSVKVHNRKFGDGVRKYHERGIIRRTEHLTLTIMDYNNYLDLQKFTKCCLSVLIGLAIDEFADEIMSENGVNSYRLIAYSQIIMVKNNLTFYVSCWGFPFEKNNITLPLLE